MKIILASNSPRRKELLKLIISDFEILPSEKEEILDKKSTPEKEVEQLAYIKAKDVFDRTEGDRIIIGADTIVTKNSKIYGKPKDKENAKEIIKELLEGDKTHEVITGLTIIIENNRKIEEYKMIDKAKVYLKNIEDKEIQKWIDTGNAMDKAGAYGIQSEFSVFIEKIDGNYTTVVGLPVHKVYDIIKKYIEL